MLLMPDFVVLRMSIPGSSQKVTSSSATCTVANVKITLSLCPGSGVFKTFAGNVPFRAIICAGKKNFSKHFLQGFRVTKCSNSDQTYFSYTLTSAHREVFKPSPFRLGFQHLPRGPTDVNA